MGQPLDPFHESCGLPHRVAAIDRPGWAPEGASGSGRRGGRISRGILLPPVSDGTPGYLAGAPHTCAHDDRRGAVTYACSTRCEMQSVSERGGSMAKLIYSAITSLDGYVADE